MQGCDALLVPAAPGEAPSGLSATGHPDQARELLTVAKALRSHLDHVMRTT